MIHKGTVTLEQNSSYYDGLLSKTLNLSIIIAGVIMKFGNGLVTNLF